MMGVNKTPNSKQYITITAKNCQGVFALATALFCVFSMKKSALQFKMSAKRRKAGVELATELEVKYRREGRFFDEILKGE